MAKKKQRRLVSLGVSLGLSVSAACNSRPESTPPKTEQRYGDPAPTKKPSDSAPKLNIEAISNAAQYAIAPYAVQKKEFAKRVLYTWTTNTQIDELRQSSLLLSRSESPQFGPSGFDQRVGAEQGANYEMTELLKRPQLSMRRFAWPVPWATVLGFNGENYGNQLIRVTLKEDALIASFTPGDSIHWALVDLSNKPVPLESLKDHPEKLAAIYYEATDEKGALLYREYVLCNESMIEKWEYATTDLLDELSREEESLRKFIEWAKVAPDAKEVARFFDVTRAFPVKPYTAAVDDLTALADILLVQKSAQSAAMTITPTIEFADIGVVKIPPVAIPATPVCLSSYCPPPPKKPKTIFIKKSKVVGTF
jgi:hypothetical protein